MTRIPEFADRRTRITDRSAWDEGPTRSSLLASVSVRTRLLAVAVVFGLGFVAFGVAQVVSRQIMVGGLGEMLVANQVATSHGNADMMHDALRGDVLGAMLAETPQELEVARADLRDHLEQFEQLVGQMIELETDPDTKVALTELRAPLAAYGDAAEQLAGLAGTDRAAARAQMPTFYQSFKDLEVKMEVAGERVSARAAASQEQTVSRVDRIGLILATLGIVAAIGSAMVAVAITRSVVQPLETVVSTLESLSRRDCSQRATVTGSDELADVARALNASMSSTSEAVGSIRTAATELAASAAQLTQVGRRVGDQVQNSTNQIQSAASAADLVSANVRTLATGVEEMGVAIREVARSAAQAARVGNGAVDIASRTNDTMARLGDSSSEIGKVVKVITAIAQQTNLLALNATIEAARAGESGKGFAIVANEVKELAKQTARATEDIHRRVEAIQTDTRVAGESITEITSVIQQMNELQVTIAGAVEEQTATASEIARNVADAAQGSTEIAMSISGVVDVSRETASGANEFQAAAAGLERLAHELQSVTDTFRT